MSKTNGEQNSLGNFEERNNTFLDSFEEKDYKIDNVFEKYKTFRQRLDEFHKLEQNKLKFSNDIYLIGFGSVGRVLTHILQRLIDFNHLFIFERRELDKSEKEFIANYGGIVTKDEGITFANTINACYYCECSSEVTEGINVVNIFGT